MKKHLIGCAAFALALLVAPPLVKSWMDSHPPTPPASPPTMADEVSVASPSSPVVSEVPAEFPQFVEVEFSLSSIGIADHSTVVYERPEMQTNTVAVVAQ